MSSTLSTSHAVSRSSELLSCAKTALKIANTNNNSADARMSPNELHLHSFTDAHDTHVQALLEDGLTLLRQMKQSLEMLSSLVKRRGHTNDPTEEISFALSQWEEAAKELSHVQVIPIPLRNKQQARHYEFVNAWLQAVAAQQASSLKEILKVRGAVLQEQAQRRKLLTSTKHTSRNTSNQNNTAIHSPLFYATTMNTQNGPARQSSLRPTNGTTHPPSSAPSSFYGGYGASYGSSGYGGASQSMHNTGMRQRKGTTHDNTTTQDATVQMQIQERQERRATKSRLESAKQAKSTLAELGTLFGKMSTLIVSQGEVLEKVEDDVEAAYGDVSAGEQEIQTLYSIKKGNRGLIVKVFLILIFFIIFMRLY